MAVAGGAGPSDDGLGDAGLTVLRRTLDLALTAPLLAAGGLLARVAGASRPRTRVLRVHGGRGSTLSYRVSRRFARGSWLWPLNYVDALRLVLEGRLSLVGPRPVLAYSPRPRYARFSARPGLVSSHLVRKRVNIAFESADEADAQLLRSLDAGTYLATLARFALTLVLGGGRRTCPARLCLLDVPIDNLSLADAIERIRVAARGPGLSRMAFVNADCLNIATQRPDYRRALAGAGAVFPDGIGIHYALRLFSRFALRENVNGTDLFPRLAAMMQDEGLSLFLLGARPGVAEEVAAMLRSRFPRLRLAGVRHGYFEGDADHADAVARINAAGADVVLVAMGAPSQELWIERHAAALEAGVAIGVGGLFDFYSGRVARAPQWMREVGLEWLYRLLQEPSRMWRRYLVGNPRFLWRVWRWSRADRAGGVGTRFSGV